MSENGEKAKSNYWVVSGVLNLFQNFSGTLMGFIGFAILAHVLDTDTLGEWFVFGTVGSILELIRGGLVTNAVIKFVAAQPKDEGEVFTAALVISGILTAFCTLLIICFAGIFSRLVNSPEIEVLLYWYIPIFILAGLLTQLCCVEQAHLSYKGVVACNFVRSFVFCIYLVFCFFSKKVPSLTELVIVQLLSAAAAVVTSWIYVKKYMTFAYRFSMEWAKKIFHYGKFAFGTSLSSLLSGTVDQMMLASMMNPGAAALFNVAVRIINLIDIPTNAIATIVFPQSAKRMETDGKEAIKYLYERSVGAILAVLIPGVIIAFCFSDLLLFIIGGDKFAKAVPILHVALLYALFIPYGRQFGAILDSIGKTRLTFLIVIFTGGLNLILNFFFIRAMGPMGAAIATLISNVAGFIAAQVILYRELNVNAFHPLIYAVHFYTEFYKNHVKKFFNRQNQPV